MASRRDKIRMSDRELERFLADHHIVSCATLGPRGRPHLVPLWYLPEGRVLRGWTYAKSQKARNLEREPRATIGIEDGVKYEELRGVMFECDVEVERDSAKVEQNGLMLFERYAGELTPEIRDMVAKQAPKRVGLRFVPSRTVSWDHRKLGGTY